jgi:DNA-binding CsgD family transcriptional regulator
LQRPSGIGQIAVFALPFETAPGERRDHNTGTLVFISDPRRKAGWFDPEVIGRFYAMTPAEARLTSRMAYGNSLESIAAELGISIHTARTHLKRIFEKTGVARQAELVHVLHNTFGFLHSEGTADASPQQN